MPPLYMSLSPSLRMTLRSVGCVMLKSMIFCCLRGENKIMNHYITGAVIKQLREQKRLTQAQLAEKLRVSDKAISKWETGVSQT